MALQQDAARPGARLAAGDARSPRTGPLAVETVLAEPRATAMLFMRPGRPHEPGAVPQVRLRPGEVLVRVELATVCGSDVHTVLGHRSEPTPLVLGHEAVGRVMRTGPGGARAVDGDVIAPGDRVVWSIAVHCGACDRCDRGLTQKCRALRKYGHERIGHGWELTGGFATHVHLLAGTPIVRVDEEVPAAVLAPAGCGVSTAWAALRAAERTVPLDGATVLVTGAGLIGLAASAMATERGARVVLSDPSPERRALGARFGAVVTCAPGEEPAEVDVALDASGAPSAVAAGLAALAVGGAAVWVGSVFPTDPVPVVPERVVRGLVSVSGVHNYAPEDLRETVGFLRAHWRDYPFAELVGRTYALADLDDALARAAERREARVGIDPAPRRE